MKILNFIVDIIKGVYYKYPLCCILQYAIVVFEGGQPADRLWNHFPMNDKESYDEAEKFNYVQCDECIEKYLKRIRGECDG